MKKHSKCILFLALSLSTQTAFAYDMEDGVWKNLNEKHAQTVNNKKLISGMLGNRIYYTKTHDSDSRNNEYSDTYLKSRLGVNLKLTNNFSLKSIAKLEKVSNSKSTPDGTDRTFDNQGAFLDELVLGYDYKNFSALAGKMTMNFGDAWKVNNGIWVNEIAHDSYEQNEKLGIGATQRFGDPKVTGEYVFGISAFTNDRKNFDNSVLENRNGVSKSSGEAGDTRNLKSYVLSTDIYYDFGEDEKLSYHFSYLDSAINDRRNTSNTPEAIDNEKAYALNMRYKYPLSQNFALDGFIEYVEINNLGGNSAADSRILTVNLTTYIYKYFFVTLARSKEQQFKVAGNGVDESINEYSIGYKFDKLHKYLKGLSVLAGYREGANDDKVNLVRDNSFGLLINHKIEF